MKVLIINERTKLESPRFLPQDNSSLPARNILLVFVIIVKSPVRFVIFQLLKFNNLEQKAKTCYNKRITFISQYSKKIFLKKFQTPGIGLKSF